MMDIEAAHEAACAAGEKMFVDPASGYSVFTRVGLLERGRCCGSGCRFCPYAHENIPLEKRAGKIQNPAVLVEPRTRPPTSAVVVFCSGGKDSFLAARALRREKRQVALLTTFDATSRRVAHQEVGIAAVVELAKALDVLLVGVPLPRGDGDGYASRIRRGLDVLEARVRIEALAFGDLHLQDIKKWRDDTLGPLGYRLEYPIFSPEPGANYADLMDDLEASNARCVVSATTVPSVAVGQVFDRAFYDRLQAKGDIDAFGENGEFHTRVVVLADDDDLL